MSFPQGKVIKTFMFYRTPWWRVKGFSGQLVADVGAVIASPHPPPPPTLYLIGVSKVQ